MKRNTAIVAVTSSGHLARRAGRLEACVTHQARYGTSVRLADMMPSYIPEPVQGASNQRSI
jgi:hypothetical protein